jgi:glycine dehydrogenase subunit 1
LAGIARACVAKAHYLRERLLETGRFRAPWEAPFGYEFALEYLGDVRAMQDELMDRGFFAGVDVSDVEAEHPTGALPTAGANLVLFAVTEKNTAAEMDAFAKEVASL